MLPLIQESDKKGLTMKSVKIVAIPGDGIGPEIMKEVQRVLARRRGTRGVGHAIGRFGCIGQRG